MCVRDMSCVYVLLSSLVPYFVMRPAYNTIVISPLPVRAGHPAVQTAPARPSGEPVAGWPAHSHGPEGRGIALHSLTTSVSNGGADSD